MKALILGCGSIGRRHASNMARMGVELYLHDTRPELSEALASEVGGTAVADPDEAKDLDAVVIATPSVLHPEDLEWAVSRTAYTLVEKPLAIDSEGLRRAVRAVERQKDAQVMVACNLRYTDGFATLAGALERVGQPVAISATFGHYLPDWRPGTDYRELYSARRQLGGGIILDAIHEFDYVLSLAGPIGDLWACWTTSQTLELDVDDCAEVIMRHQSGVLSHLHLDYLRRKYRRGCCVIGSDGEIAWDYAAGTVEALDAGGLSVSLLAGADLDRNQMYVREMESFLDAVHHQAPVPMGTLSEAAAACEAALTALRVGAPQ